MDFSALRISPSTIRGFQPIIAVLCLLIGLQSVMGQEPIKAEKLRERGEQLFAQGCADCHGEVGQGVKDVFPDPLHGDDSIGQLSAYIEEMMPEGSPEDCVGDDAKAVAEYMHYAFYSEAAQVRNRPPRVALARLTSEQLKQSLADVYSSFAGLPQFKDLNHGVDAKYYNGSKRTKNLKKERVDPVVNFDFGREGPIEGVEAKEFAIDWSGGIIAEDSGSYEIVVRSSCSFVMRFGHYERTLIDNHVQSGDKTEFRVRIELTGGRVYPFWIEFRQRKRKTELPPANISLAWVPPGRGERVIPNSNLVTGWIPSVFALQTNLPPDDRTYGYERGISVSKEWDASTTAAALEFAQIAFEELWPEYRKKHRKEGGTEREKLKGFLVELLGVAFHAPLNEPQIRLYVDKQLEAEADDVEAVRRALLLGLKSPSFLFPLADASQQPSQQVANRLALILYDSIPTDGWILDGAKKGYLSDPSSIRDYATKNLDDFRVRHKMREMLRGWLNLSHISDISKDQAKFEAFDAEVVSDLLDSLYTSMDTTVWSEQSDYRELIRSPARFTTKRIHDLYGSAWEPSRSVEHNAAGLVSAKRAENGADEDDHSLLTHPYLLSGLAYHDSTSPIHRGVFLIRYMLGRTLRPPAEAFSPLSPKLHPDLTTRERVELQTSPASCQTCHSKINSLGFVLENYDAIGRFRESELEKTINSLGSYTTKQGEYVEFDDVGDLTDFLANSGDAHEAFVRRAFHHFVKQPPAAFGADTLERLVESFEENDFNIRKLLIEIAVVAAQPPTQKGSLAANP